MISLKILNQHNERTDPMPSNFNYGAEFEKLDLSSLKSDLTALMTDSQDFWPADYGHYGPFLIRMACKYIFYILFFMTAAIACALYVPVCDVIDVDLTIDVLLCFDALKTNWILYCIAQGTAQELIECTMDVAVREQVSRDLHP